MDKKDLGKKIREGRKLLGLSLNDFANLAGTSKTTLQRIETGEKSPSVDLLYEIAQICRKPIDEFLDNNQSDFLILNSEKQRKISGKDFDVSIICPYGLISRNMVVNHYKGKPGAHIEPTKDKGHHLVYVLKGSCFFHYDGSTHKIKKGDVIYYNASKTFSFKVLKYIETIRIALRP